jgi:methyltransferase
MLAAQFPALVLLILAAVLGVMLIELLVSRRNEAVFRRHGAVAAPDDVYGVMRVAYPGAFVLMATEGMVRAEWPVETFWWGAAIFAAGKALKTWAIVSLGYRWTYRVLVLPGAALVRTGPYAWLRHPNYVGVVGELVGMALMVGAWITGPIATLGFGWLLLRRMASEERALGMRGVPL